MPILTLKKHNEILKIPFSGTPLLKDLLEKEMILYHSPCGGKGKCGKCAVKIQGDISDPDDREKELSCRLACRTVLYGDSEAELLYNEEFAYVEDNIGPVKSNKADWRYASAVDIGTTTVALKIFDGNGNILSESSMLNPQRSISSDVLGRINASSHGKISLLQEQIVNCINELLSRACNMADIKKDQVEKLVITGNTAMLYFLCGYDAASIATYPFNADCLFGTEIKNPLRAYLPPCMSAFNGADTVCAVLASGMCEREATALLCDIGTNGEIALWKNGVLYVTSAAAGPAFEGAEIKCGCGYISGAIDRIYIQNGRIIIHTVDNEAPKGICGSGLLDAVAVFLELGYMEETGKISSDLKITDNVYLTQDDISALQFAKSAICSGIEVLLSQTETSLDEIETLYLSGGFGNNLPLDSAARIGLLPETLIDRTKSIGNGALHGAVMMLFDEELIEKSMLVARNSIHIELGGNEDFNRAFITNLSFSKR